MMITRAVHTFWPLPMALSLNLSGWAQTPPDAGSLRQQIEQQRTLPLPAARAPSAALPPSIKPTVGTSVTVRSFRLVGNSKISSEQLASALAPYVGQTLDFAGLQRSADAVAEVYRAAGWIVRTYLPEQDISDGTVTLQVIEALFAGLRFEGEPSKRVSREQLQAIFSRQQSLNQALNAHALDRALLLANDLPGLGVAGTLVPGTEEAQTALVLQTIDEPSLGGDGGIDNHGARATGIQRLTANMNINSLWGRGELIGVNLLHTQGSHYARAGLTMPLGHDGMRVGVSASVMAYKVIDGPNNIQKLGIQGHSGSVGLDLSYPLVRARKQNLYLSGALETKRFYSEDKNKSAEPNSYADYASKSLRLGLSGNRFDDLGGGGANSASLQWQTSQLAHLLAHKQIDSIDRKYTKLNYSLSRQQTLSTDHALLLSLQGQHTTQVLDSSEKFYIGGVGSVRAYPSSELGGERGHVLMGEWRWRLNQSWIISAFVDRGYLVLLPSQSGDVTTPLQLRGRGLSAFWQGPMGINARVTWSQREGQHPRPTPSGTDSDGTLKKNRIWLNASWTF
jgi:hemolysin activation/secretion protein